MLSILSTSPPARVTNCPGDSIVPIRGNPEISGERSGRGTKWRASLSNKRKGRHFPKLSTCLPGFGPKLQKASCSAEGSKNTKGDHPEVYNSSIRQ
ncbi:hypothetical protein RRG08_029612 [Elysia crispata]|uniref:Uncharacterized protein n=1 Tax=Elysia crispata TaxID=231223 RepID=A0AAE0XPE8_9GAST|nr:hypothetical protein RRG08_029612 [Elysia crispata]